MNLNSLVGRLNKRLPGFGVCVELKTLYVTYPFLTKPNIDTSRKNILTQHDIVIETFVTLLEEYGFTNLKDWNLYIDAREDWWMPHIEMPEALELFSSMFKEIYILSNSIFDNSDVKYPVEFFPTYSANLFNYYDDLQNLSINFKDIKLDKHFIVLARRPSRKRVLLVKRILDKFFDDTRATCGNRWPINHKNQYDRVGSNPRDDKNFLYWKYYDIIKTKKDVSVDDNVNFVTYRLPRNVTEIVHYKDLFQPYDYPLTLDDDVVSIEQQHKAQDTRFFSALINVVCETTEDDHHPINLSEKTFKAFAWHQIPIWHSINGTVAEVKKLGFDLFEDIINHSYDLETNYDMRLELLMTELENFKNKYPTTNDVNNLRLSIYQRLEANNKLLSQYVESERVLDINNLFKVSNRHK